MYKNFMKKFLKSDIHAHTEEMERYFIPVFLHHYESNHRLRQLMIYLANEPKEWATICVINI